MTVSPHAQPQPARATATQQATVAVPQYILDARKSEEAVLSKITQNPIYQFIFTGDDTKETRGAKVEAYLLAGLADGTAKPEDLDKRRLQLAELNASIQVLRKQLGSEQAREITNKAYADFQQIVNTTSHDVDLFQSELAPLCDLAELFAKYGANGNLIENLNRAKEQKAQRTARIAEWWRAHEVEVLAYRRSVGELEAQIVADKVKLASAWIGKGAIEARITNGEADLLLRRQQLTEASAKTPPVETGVPVGESADDAEIKPVNEEILKLQDIGGKEFKQAIITLRDHTEEALAKISLNFNSAVEGLSNARESFIKMDRNCGDATFALTVLEFAVQSAEAKSREIAQGLISNASTGTGAKAELDRMEQEARSEQLLSYTASLTTFLTDINVAVTSLRSGKTVIQTILRMNQMALEQANTHKITGIANTADAVTITIGSIIEAVNRAAGQTLADGLSRLSDLAQAGSARLVGGTVESLKQQNRQLADVVENVAELKRMTTAISANTVGLLKSQFEIIGRMREESGGLADATTEAQRTSFAARAGVDNTAATQTIDVPTSVVQPGFRMRMGQPHE